MANLKVKFYEPPFHVTAEGEAILSAWNNACKPIT